MKGSKKVHISSNEEDNQIVEERIEARIKPISSNEEDNQIVEERIEARIKPKAKNVTTQEDETVIINDVDLDLPSEGILSSTIKSIKDNPKSSAVFMGILSVAVVIGSLASAGIIPAVAAVIAAVVLAPLSFVALDIISKQPKTRNTNVVENVDNNAQTQSEVHGNTIEREDAPIQDIPSSDSPKSSIQNPEFTTANSANKTSGQSL